MFKNYKPVNPDDFAAVAFLRPLQSKTFVSTKDDGVRLRSSRWQWLIGRGEYVDELLSVPIHPERKSVGAYHYLQANIASLSYGLQAGDTRLSSWTL